MKRYYLQDGDGVHVRDATDMMLVMRGGSPSLPAFDADSITLEFHWERTEPYPVLRDQRGYYVEVDDATWEELQGPSGGD